LFELIAMGALVLVALHGLTAPLAAPLTEN